MALLDIRDLVISFPHRGAPARVVHHVDLTVGEGEAFGIVGESGCGKSLTALAIMGLLPEAAVVSGSIRLDGQEIVGLDDASMSRMRGRRIGMIFQEPMSALNPVLPIGDQVAEGPMLHLGLSARAARDRAREMLDRVGLPAPRFDSGLYPHELSGGQRQRVVAAIALACDPRLLIADEPTTALDVTIQAQILDLLATVSSEAGMALVMISHDLGVIAETTDRMAVMYAGTIAEEGPTRAVFADMAHPYTRDLLAAMPATSRRGERLATIAGRAPDPRAPRVGCPYAARCPLVRERCRAHAPPPFEYAPAHRARCFYPGPSGAGP